MILDARDLPAGQTLTADLCLVGAGAVGIAMALELAGSGLSVILLESGGFGREEDSQALYRGAVTDPARHSPLDRYRERRLGGSTTTWGGRSMPLDPIDFEPRPAIPHSGWPIGPADLAPFYPRANRLVEAGAFAYTAETAFDRTLRPMIPGFASPHFTTNTLERFSCPTDFGRRYRHKLEQAADLRVLLHANVVHIALSDGGERVEALEVRTLQGGAFRVAAGRFVLATGGLETVRLLLASHDRAPAGIGNHHDLVGRFYMCHLAGTIGRLRIDGPPFSAWNGYDIADDGTYCRRRIALRPDVQRELGLGNVIARLHHPRITDPSHRNGALSLLYLARAFIPYEYGKRLHGGEAVGLADRLRHLGNVAGDLPATIGFMLHLLRDRRLAERKFPSIVIRSRANLFSLDFHAEQQPDPASRVTLGHERDALGLPRLVVDWRYGRGDVDTVSRTLALFAVDIAASCVGRFDYDPDQVESEMTRYGAYGGHHIGVARMSDSPRQGVVDRDGRVHGIANLHLAGSAVFPTSSQANPTLTAIALGLRLAHHLRDRAAVPAGTTPSPAPPSPVAPSGVPA